MEHRLHPGRQKAPGQLRAACCPLVMGLPPGCARLRCPSMGPPHALPVCHCVTYVARPTLQPSASGCGALDGVGPGVGAGEAGVLGEAGGEGEGEGDGSWAEGSKGQPSSRPHTRPTASVCIVPLMAV